MTEAITRQVVVDATPERAFELFTGHIGAWWPLDLHSVFGDGTVAFESSVLVERSDDRQSTWAEVLDWSAPDSLTITWHPGYDSMHATEIHVSFVAVEDETLVTLTHRGWERMADPDAAAEEYGAGWPLVLMRYRELIDEVGR